MNPRNRIAGSQENLETEEFSIGSDAVGRIRELDAVQGIYAFEWRLRQEEDWSAVVYHRPDRVTATIIATVGLRDNGKFSYRYEIRNSIDSGQYLSGFFLQTFAESTRPLVQPETYVGAMSEDIPHFSEGTWMTFLGDVAPQRIERGATAFVEIESDGPPQIVNCRISGGPLTLQGGGEELPPQLEDRMLRSDAWPMGFTIGPSDSSRLQTRQGRITYAASEFDRLVELGWLDAQLTEEYQAAFAREGKGADSSIEELLQRDMQRQRITPEFAALLSFLPPSAHEIGPEVLFADALRSGGKGPQMAWIPPGRFRIGCAFVAGCDNRGLPYHEVEFAAPFGLSRNTVTRGEFARFVEATGYQTEGEGGQGCRTWAHGWERDVNRTWRNPGFAQTDSHPAVCVSWNDAVAYTQWLANETGRAYRLPSDAEWEYAARAGSSAILGYEDDQSELCTTGNIADRTAQRRYAGWSIVADCYDNYVHTAPVGQFRANDFGLFDMHGNVREWVEDCRNSNLGNMPADGSAWTGGDCRVRAQRGFSWAEGPQAFFPDLRFSNRNVTIPTFHSIYTGFRVAVGRQEQPVHD